MYFKTFRHIRQKIVKERPLEVLTKMATATPANSPSIPTYQSKCLFCKLAQNQDSKERILYEKDGIVIFKDIHPASDHHYLVIPSRHVTDPKHLKQEDVQLIEQLLSAGKEFLINAGGSIQDARFGFHWPPFNSIAHLHLHVISPVKNMGFLASVTFKANSYWFVSPEWLIERLNKMKPVKK